MGRKPLEVFEAADRIRGGYDAVVCCLSATPEQSPIWRLLRRAPAVVLAHDVRLASLNSARMAKGSVLERPSAADAVGAAYADRVGAALEDPADATEVVQDPNRFGALFMRQVISPCTLCFVHSAYDAELARLDASADDEAKIDVVPFGFRADKPRAAQRGAPALVATFGAVDAEPQVQRLIDVVARLRSAGDAPVAELARVLEEVLRNEERLTELVKAARKHARTASMKSAATAILDRSLAPRVLTMAPN